MIEIPFPPELRLGPLSISWHSIAILIGFLVGWFLFERLARRRGYPEAFLEWAPIVALLVGIVGARLYYVAQSNPMEYLRNPVRILEVWRGGLAFYGTVALVPLAFLWLTRRYRVPFWSFADLMALVGALGMAIGRIGDVIIGEHYGPPTSLPWGVVYSVGGLERPTPGIAVQSGALYEVGIDLLIFAAAWFLKDLLTKRPGLLFAFVLGTFALSRVVIFSVVRDVPEVAFGMNNAQLTSIFALVVSLMIAAWRRKPKTVEPEVSTGERAGSLR
ncbi:MAG: prolipoprotein diacylglyceryl transferase [Rubrobacteraceae bacterium]|uniref:prolipoprotein diacylglyceryl transferase n=1 Tax=Rubrobacter calidifluminis TaxID=1392640 RepID=UPI00235FCD76|nr:prolipoprotein diacylglyceryl transferase [Rubrobacter calidifluminis]MBX6763162.1 prolipoprotein diacylglyceryl transferase [Rubrobacteraceae bacterium]